MSKLDEILEKPLHPLDYELLKRGDTKTSEEVSTVVKQELKQFMFGMVYKYRSEDRGDAIISGLTRDIEEL